MGTNAALSQIAAVTVISERQLYQKRRDGKDSPLRDRKEKKNKNNATWAGFADIQGDSRSRFSKQA